MKKISILGCGWLGLPLAKSLLKKGFSVKGSTTSTEKIAVLEAAGIEPFQLEVSETKIIGAITMFIENSEILIINIPPKLRGNSAENFVAKIQNLLPFIANSSVKKVVFISSTSVYEDQPWSDENPIIYDENSLPNAQSESGKQLLETEQFLQNNKNFQTTVIRFGGLIGEDRHPIRFLAGRKNIENPDAPINLIHQLDCIGIIELIIKKGLRQAQYDRELKTETFNAVAPFHPTRKDYYTQKAIALNLALPEFEQSKPSVGKIISSEKVESVLEYKFKNKLL